MCIVKQEQKDLKKRFNRFELEVKEGIDISYPEIKIASRSQTNHDNVKVVNNVTTGKTIKTKDSKSRK